MVRGGFESVPRVPRLYRVPPDGIRPRSGYQLKWFYMIGLREIAGAAKASFHNC